MASGGIPQFDDYKPKAITVTGKVPNFDDYVPVPDHVDRSVRDHLKDEGFLDSVWNVVKSPVSILYSLVSGEDAKSGSEDRKRADELQRSGTPEQRREFAKEIILKNIPGASTIYKATHGNVSGAAGDVTGALVLGGLIKGGQKTVDAAGTIREIVTDPAVVKATRAALPKNIKTVIDTAEAVRNRISAGRRGGPVEQPQGGHFSNPPSEILPQATEQPQGGHFPARTPMGPPPAPPEPVVTPPPAPRSPLFPTPDIPPEYGPPAAAALEAAATRPADVGRMAPAEAIADFEQRLATRTQGQPPTPGQQFAESQGYDWTKLSPDDRLALEQVAKAQANMAAQNLEVPPQPPPPAAPARPQTLTDLMRGTAATELEAQLAESIRQAQDRKPPVTETPPPAPAQKPENVYAKNARLAKAVRVADAAQEAGLKSGDIFRMSPAEFAEKVGEKSISADTMAMVVDKLRRLESQAPPTAPTPAPTGPKSTPPAASVRKARAKKVTLKDLMQPD